MSLSKPLRPSRRAKPGLSVIAKMQSSSTETLTDKSEFLSKNQTVRKGKTNALLIQLGLLSYEKMDVK